MNKNLYRIVFNKVRGILMVVAENVSAQGKGDAASSVSSISKHVKELCCIRIKSISFAAKLVAGVMSLLMPLAHAQIVADPSAPSNQRPTILETANGLPQVNIRAPSAAGVSRNTYSQFDVQSNGAILNNSRTNVQTQTGGWVQANPWLVGGTARVILNEVNSSNPSQLRGFVEVAGQRAEVIIANPAGIQVNGGGFINADRVTLTTGKAVMNPANGSLDSYRISQGVISVDGLGLDTRTASYTDILARSVQVNAGIWADRLHVITGANEISINSTDYPENVVQVTPIAATGPTPQFSLDVAALGGMYAGHIYLVGSENGLGVRNQGIMNAASGNLVLLSNGFLTNEGAIQAASSNGSGGNLKIETAGSVNNVGATAVISAQEHVTIAAAALTNTTGARIDATRSLVVKAESVNNAGKLGAGEAVTVSAQNIDNAVTGEMASATTLAITADSVNNAGRLVAGDAVTVSAQSIDNAVTGEMAGTKTLAIIADSVSNAGLLGAGDALTVSAQNISNTVTGEMMGTKTLAITADSVNNAGKLGAGEVVTVSAQSIGNAATGEIASTKTLAITAESVANAGKLVAGEAVTVSVVDINNAATGEIAGAMTAITSTRNLTNRGLIDGSETLLQTGTLDNIGTGRIYGDHLGIAAEALTNDTETINGVRSDAVIAARERLDLGVGTFDNRNDALLFSAGTGTDALNIGGSLDTQAHATGTAGTINNKAATIESLGGVTISAQQINNINPDFSTRTDTTSNATYVHYVRLGGTRYLESALGRCFKCASDRADDGDPTLPRYEYVAPSSAYPFEAGYSRVPYQLNVYEYYDTEVGPMTVTTPYLYPSDSPVWALFNVPVGDQVTLRNRLISYNQNMIYRAYRDFYQIWVTSTQTVQTVVDNPGAPGRIVSGGGMTLSGGAILNDNSQILAGGNLNITGSSLTNTETSGQRVVTDFGTFRGDSVQYRRYGIHAGYYGSGAYAEVVESVTTKLDTSVAKGNTNATGSGTQVEGRTALNTPTSSLVRYTHDPAATTLYQIDPRFSSQQWLSSDYMLQELAADPNTMQKRLGDGFYEQKLVREQVAELTGRRFLDGYGSDEAQYQALMQAGVAYAKQWELVPGVSLTPAQMAQLTSDIVWLVAQEVVLPDGSTTIALVPQVYVMPREGDLAVNGSLLAGQNVNIQLSGDLSNSGTIAGRNVTQINANNVQNLGDIAAKAVSVVAQQDLVNLGGRIIAEEGLMAAAGRNIIVQSTTSTGSAASGRSNSSLTQVDRVAGLYVTGDKGILVASAGNDFSVLAGVLSSTGDIQVTAANNVNLGTVDTSYKSDLTANDRNYMRASGTQEVGSQIVSGGNTTFVAGNDFNARAASVNAEGNLVIGAEGDIQITEGRATSQSDDARYAKSKGFLSSSSTESREQSLSDSAIGSNFGGKTITLTSGGDTLIRGSSVIGDEDTTVVAGENLTIEAATNTSQSSSFYESKKSGLFSGGGLSVTLGKQQLNVDKERQSTIASASTVGSIGGDVKLVAGQAYSQIGSDVLAPTGDITIAAKKVDIVAATNTDTNTTEQRYKQSGITLAISSPVISAIQTVQQMADAASKTQDGRMQALAGATSALSAKNAYDAIQAGQGTTINGQDNQIATGKTNLDGSAVTRDANAADQVGGVNISISIGASSSQSKTTQSSTQAVGSNVTAGGNVTIVASGADADSDVTIQGSNIGAGNNVLIAAENEINLIAAQNTEEQHSTNKSSSGSIGISFGTSGFGVTASASAGRGNADGSDVNWTNTHVDAGNQLVLVSGTDTNLIGAVASGKQVVATVGGNLNIESLQDTSQYDSKQKNIGGSVTIGAGGGGSFSYSKSSVNSNYASVTEQSGIKTGDGGFQVLVGGNTDLKGAVIASNEQAVQDGKNVLVTASLTTSDIQNKATYEGKSIGLNVGTAVSTNGSLAPSGTSIGFGKDSGSASSVTQSGVSGMAGNKSVRSTDQETALAKIFDAERVQNEIDAQTKITQAFGREAPKAAASFAINQAAELRSLGKEEEAKKWDEGGTYRIALHTVLGGMAGGLNGALGAGAVAGAAPLLEQFQDGVLSALKDVGVNDAVAKGAAQLIAQGAAAGVGAAVSGGSVAGAGAAFNVDTNNRQLHAEDKAYAKKLAANSGGKYTQEQIEDAMRAGGNSIFGEDVTSGMVVPLTGDTLASAIYDSIGMKLVDYGGGKSYLVQQVPSYVDPQLAAYIQAGTGGSDSPYNWNPTTLGITLPNTSSSSSTSPFYPGWNNGYSSAGLGSSGLATPDYVAAQGSAFGGSFGIAINLHNGQVFSGLGGNVPVTTGGSLNAGFIPSNSGLSNSEKAGNTSNFLVGAGANATGCLAVVCVGVNHSFGGGTSIELGVGGGFSAGTGYVKEVGKPYGN